MLLVPVSPSSEEAGAVLSCVTGCSLFEEFECVSGVECLQVAVDVGKNEEGARSVLSHLGLLGGHLRVRFLMSHAALLR